MLAPPCARLAVRQLLWLPRDDGPISRGVCAVFLRRQSAPSSSRCQSERCDVMRSSNNSLSALARFGGRLSLVSTAGVLFAAAAWGQAATSPADSRYALPPEATAQPATDSEPLINWRRDDASTVSTQSTSGDETNPLRTPSEPPPQFAPIATTPAATPILPATTPPAEEPSVTPPSTTLPNPELPAEAPPFTTAPVFQHDPALAPAAHVAEAPSDVATLDNPSQGQSEDEPIARRLAPPSSDSTAEEFGATGASTNSPLPFNFSKLESLSTAGMGLAVVVGLFLVCMWMLRRSGPKPNGALPSDAFAVLGRAPLSPQSFAHLLRVGNKLVLVAMTPSGVQPLTEVTDPMEVDRLAGLCAGGRGHGPSAEFQQVLAQLSREPARGFLGAEAAAGGGRRR